MEENRDLVVVNDEVNEISEESKSGMSTGVAMLIGGGITLAVTAGVKKLRKVLANKKAKKEVVVESKVVNESAEEEAAATEESKEEHSEEDNKSKAKNKKA